MKEFRLDTGFIRERDCPVDWARGLVRSVRRQSCGEYLFCREGFAQLERIIGDVAEGRGRAEDLDLILEICGGIQEAHDCGLSETAAEAVASSVRSYQGEWEAHVKRKHCAALKCGRLMTYFIQAEKCVGCGECIKVCSEGAIAGAEGLIHVVDQGKCTKCGACYEACAPLYGAVKKSAVNPKTPASPVPVGTWQPKGLGLRKGLRNR